MPKKEISMCTRPHISTLEDESATQDEQGTYLTNVVTSLRTHWRRLVMFFAWLGGAGLAFKFDTSAVQLYIIISIFYLIFTNLGERRNGPSAYSVFNRNCEPIMGQLTAQQFDNEVRRRAVDFNTTQPHISVNNPTTFTGDAHDELLRTLRSQIQADQRSSRRRSAFETVSSRPRRR